MKSERPLPGLPGPENARQDSLEFQPSRRSTTSPLRFRTSTRDINTSRVEGDTVGPELHHRQSISAMASRFPVLSVPARTSSQASGASSNDHSYATSNLNQAIDTIMPSSSNDVRQNADRQANGPGGYLSNDNMRSCYQNSQIAPRTISHSNSPGNLPNSSILVPTTTLMTASPNNPENGEMRVFATPRWQLDSEVNICPICKSRFSEYYF